MSYLQVKYSDKDLNTDYDLCDEQITSSNTQDDNNAVNLNQSKSRTISLNGYINNNSASSNPLSIARRDKIVNRTSRFDVYLCN